MIIGISGKIGSGKDTIGKIIQYLNTIKKDYGEHYTLEQYLENNSLASKWLENHSNWETKKFADKLKDIVCLLINCTREQLEEQEFKNKELGEEWNKWSLCYFDENNNYEKIFDTLHNLQEFANNLDKRYRTHQPQEIKMTPRLFLQLLGTECGREIIHPNIWVNSLMSEYKSLTEFPLYNENKIIKGEEHKIYPNWIITDMRFFNELNAVKSKNSITIRVNRNNKKEYIITEHQSETELDNATFDYVIENNGSIEELIKKVKEILIKENIKI